MVHLTIRNNQLTALYVERLKGANRLRHAAHRGNELARGLRDAAIVDSTKIIGYQT